MKYSTKNNGLSRVGFICILIAGLTSCTKNFDELNTPQTSLSVEKLDAGTLGQTFARAQYQSMGLFAFSYLWHSILYSDRYSQYTANFHPAFQSDQYEVSGTHIAAIWTNFYSSVGTPVKFVEDFTKANNMPVENAITKVWRVQAYHRITDEFGPIIYSQFGNAKTSVNYDSQESIYLDFFKTLDEADAVLKTNTGKTSAFGTNDLVFNGNVDKWRLFCNSLRLRLAMRIVYVNPTLAKSEAEKAVAAGVMTNNTHNANVATSVNSLNQLSIHTYLEEWRMSATIYSLLEGYNDPRKTIYMAQRWDKQGYRGLRNGLPLAQRATNIRETYSPIGQRWRPLYTGGWEGVGSNPPMPVLSSAEAFFLRAEGALRGWNMGGTATNLYNDGIRMSITSYLPTIASLDLETYISSTSLPVGVNDPWNSPPMTDIPVAYQSTATFEKQLEQIISQKWLSLFPNGYEAWAERRRTGYPKGYALIESLNPKLTKFQIIRRLQFSPNEVTANAEGLKTGIALLNGPDDNSTRVWWDAKPLSSYPTPAN